jgi:hypothetical protein
MKKTNFVDSTLRSYLIDEGVDGNTVLKEIIYRIGQSEISLSTATGLRAIKPVIRSLIFGSNRDFSLNYCF